MASLSFYVGVIGNVISVLMFLSPVGTFRRIIKNKSTEDFESLPYICTLLNACLWTYYAILKPGACLVATINGFGIVVELVFVSLFLVYAPTKTRTKTVVLVGLLNVGFLVAAILTTWMALKDEQRIDAIGLVCSALNIVMYASPLSAMKTVVVTKSVEFMPFLLSFFFFINGGFWTSYAFLTEDIFLGVPNGMGFILGLAQLILYAIYRKPKSPKNAIDRLEQGWQHEKLIQDQQSETET